jgi:hypothetical protein
VHRAARISHVWRIAIMDGRGTPTTDIAFRVAKVLDVSLYDVLAGTALPPGTCTHCGRSSTAEGTFPWVRWMPTYPRISNSTS